MARLGKEKFGAKGAARAGTQARAAAVRVAVCVLLACAFAVPAVFVNRVIGYLALFMFLAALALSYVYLRIVRAGLEFSQEGAGGGCARGESVRFSLVVRNNSPVPAVRVEALFFISDLFGGPGKTTLRPITIPPRSTKRFDFSVRFDHIGTYQVGIREVRLHDLLNVFNATQANYELQEVSVQPRLFDVASLDVSDDAFTESKVTVRSVINEGMDYAGVREYRWGDPIKTIHWKLSARTPDGAYFTRLYETATNPGVALVVDLQAPAYEAEELMGIYDTLVESALSLERYISETGMDSELLFVDDAGASRRFPGPLSVNYSEVLDTLPRVSVGSGQVALELMRTESASVYAQSNLVICTASITDDLVGAALAIKSNKRHPLIFAVVPAHIDAERRRELLRPLRRLDGSGIYYAVLSSAADLEEGD